jgi:hypothetical protein
MVEISTTEVGSAEISMVEVGITLQLHFFVPQKYRY